ncbi:MAG: ABC transporter [Bacteroidetes bacterium HGW-Bacteroidetes-4]|jgi:ATP-binding cassette subfamily F protein uup|nr:MAG: ABC transporter [Bacteroidetes bacterium HGW-Bacteroidetes-4]
MNYLQVDNLTKSFGDLELFKNISFTVDKDQRVALIARNGAGKTSLLKIIGGKDSADSGQIIFRNDISIGFLEQEPSLNPELTVMDQIYLSSDEVLTAIKNYESACADDNSDALSAAMHTMDTLKAWDYEVKIKQILAQLKITQLNQKVKELSGGQQKRLALACVLITEPDVLIMDEPTNHLDLEMIEWLENYLKSSNSTLILVTHDRYFLDRVCNVILELDNNQIYRYKGNYSYFLEKRDERIQNQTSEIEKARSLFKKELDWINRSPSARTTKAKYRIDSFYETQEKAQQRIGNEEVKIEVSSARLGKKIVDLEQINKKFGDTKIITDFSYKFIRSEKVGIVGMNGVGKTSLLNLITQKLELDSGQIEVGSTVVFGYYSQQGIQFDENKRVIDVIQELAEDIQVADGKQMTPTQFLNYFLFPPSMHYAYVYKLSGGEKRRLYLMTVLMKNPNFLILDEPTNDLDIMTLNVLEDYLKSFSGCVLLVSHDRYFMDKIVDHLFVFEGEGLIKDFPGNYSQYREWLTGKEQELKKQDKIAAPKPDKAKVQKEKTKLSYKELQEFEQLTIQIAQLEQEKANIEAGFSDGSLQGDTLIKASERHAALIEELNEKEMRWLQLSEWTE